MFWPTTGAIACGKPSAANDRAGSLAGSLRGGGALLVLAAWNARHGAAARSRPLFSILRAGQGLARRGLDQGRAVLAFLRLEVVLAVLLPNPLGLGFGGDVLKGQLALATLALDQDTHDTAVLQLAKQQLIGQWPNFSS